MEDGGDLDGTSPVGVVEALREDQFLQVSLFQFAVAGDDLVVVGHDRPLEGLLRNDEEVVVFADDIRADQGAGRHVLDFVASCEEPL